MEKWVGLCSPSVCFTVLGTALPNNISAPRSRWGTCLPQLPVQEHVPESDVSPSGI